MRVRAVVIALCVGALAVALGATAYFAMGVSGIDAMLTGLAAASGLVAAQALAGRAREHAETARQIGELSRGVAELARQVGELGRRVVAAEAAGLRGRDEARAATAPLGSEIELLGGLVQQLAESVAAHEVKLAQPLAAPAPRPEPYRAPPPDPRAVRAEHYPAPPAETPAPRTEHYPRTRTEPYPPAAAAYRDSRTAPPETWTEAPPVHRPDPAPRPSRQEAYPAIEAHAPVAPSRISTVPDFEIVSAIRDGRIDLYLQPIVTLPQRKVRHYEATAQLRLLDGRILAPADYIAAAEAAGLMPEFDDLVLLRSAQVARRINGRSRDAALFYGLGEGTVLEGGFFSRFADFLAVNPTLAPSLVLGVPQSAAATMGPLEQEGMAQLARLGVRFCLDRITDPRIEPRELGGLGIRFVKAPAAVLLDGEAAATATIHISDLSNLLVRFGIDLIVDNVATENVVADLLDYDVRFGQGHLFGPPRVVRTEAIDPATEPPSASAASAQASAVAAPGNTAHDPLPPGPRRRESEQASQRPGPNERTPQALADLARNLMRRA